MPHARLLAVEPSAALRAVLLARLTDRPGPRALDHALPDLDGDRVVGRATATYDWWAVSATGLAVDLTAAGLPAQAYDDLVVARA